MKTKIFILSTISLAFLNSCEQSKKGEWTASDIEKCQLEGKKTMSEDENFKVIKTMANINEEEFTSCLCEKLEDKYDSYKQADAMVETDFANEKGEELFMSCFGKDFQDLMKSMEKLGELTEEGGM
jgi:hypothetical protein